MLGKEFKSLVPFLLAVALAAAVVFYAINGEDDIKFQPHTNEQRLQQQLDSIQFEKEAIRRQRDSLLLNVDSLHNLRQADSALIEKLNKEIVNVKGRYKDVPRDSLSAIMDRRAMNAGLDN